MRFQGKCFGALRKAVHYDHIATISVIGFGQVRSVNAFLHHEATLHWN